MVNVLNLCASSRSLSLYIYIHTYVLCFNFLTGVLLEVVKVNQIVTSKVLFHHNKTLGPAATEHHKVQECTFGCLAGQTVG